MRADAASGPGTRNPAYSLVDGARRGSGLEGLMVVFVNEGDAKAGRMPAFRDRLEACPTEWATVIATAVGN